MFFSHLKEPLVKITGMKTTPLYLLWIYATEKASETPVFAIIGGIWAGCNIIVKNRNEKTTPEKIGAIGLATVIGMVGGYALAPLTVIAAPLLAPVGLFAAYDHYKHSKQLK